MRSESVLLRHCRRVAVRAFFLAGVVFSAPLRAAPATTASSERLEFKVLKVYSAKDGSHVSRGYLIEWNGQEVVVPDRIGQAKYRTDDTITVTVRKAAYPQARESHGLLSFILMRDKFRRVQAEEVSGPPNPQASSMEAGNVERKVLKVFSVQDGIYIYRAYICEWNGEEVIVQDPLSRSEYKIGDTINVMIFKFPYLGADRGSDLMLFQTDRPQFLRPVRK
jgi:hypothetical protein